MNSNAPQEKLKAHRAFHNDREDCFIQFLYDISYESYMYRTIAYHLCTFKTNAGLTA